MRVLFVVHHTLSADAGAPGATLALGKAIERAGCEVGYYAFDHAFPRSRTPGRPSSDGIPHQLRFPWVVSAHLATHGHRYDVVDASTGDAWGWAAVRRPGKRAPALVTRTHGLEQLADERKRGAARNGGPELSRKYPIYHGGFRLWEVRRSLVAADHCVVLNSAERDYVRDRMHVPEERLSVIPNGIPEHFLAAPAVEPSEPGPLRIAYIGRWTTYKGRDTLLETVAGLESAGVDFRLTIMGTPDAGEVLGDFPASTRPRVAVVPGYANSELPELLKGHQVFFFPTISEGSSVSLVEAMACGLAPVATAVGAAPDLIEPDENGTLFEVGDAAAAVAALVRLGHDRSSLDAMRGAAQATARESGWEPIADRTLALYRAVRSA